MYQLNQIRSFNRARFFCGTAIATFIVAALVTVSLGGCVGEEDREVVVYTALDREFSEPILEEFENETGIKVLAKYDVESTKTVGLTTEIMQSGNNPKCDVFWNNEILHTLRLKKAGLLEVYLSPSAMVYPANYVDQQKQWHAFAARARVIIVNTDLLPGEAEHPDSINDFADEKWKGKCAIAKPLFGTTASHAAVLFDLWGAEKAGEYFAAVKTIASIETGNKQVAQKVARGEFMFGLTDTDDAIIELDAGHPVAIIFPDQGDGQMGTLFIPNSLCIIKNGPNTGKAKALVDWLLDPKVEIDLANGSSAQFPVNPNVKTKPRVAPQKEIRWAKPDFQAAADKWDEASEVLQKLFD